MSDDGRSGAGRARRRYGRAALGRSVPAALLLLSAAVAAVGAVNAHRTHRSHRATAEALVRDYGIFAAWSFGNRVEEALSSSLDRTLSGALRAAQRRATTQECLSTLLLQRNGELCACGPGLTGPDSWAFHATLTPGGAEAFHQGPVPDAATLRSIMAEVAADVRASYRGPGFRYRLRWIAQEEGERLIAFAVTPAFSGDTVFYGVEVDPTRFHDAFASTMERGDLLPRSLQQGRSNAELLSIDYTRDDGRRLFASEADAPMELSGEHRLPEMFGGGVLRASVLPGVADALIIGGLPDTRVPYLLVLFGLSGALALAAVFHLRKEASLARERQDFVAGVSHELRTPLTQVRLFVETLRLGRMHTDADRGWALATIDRETLRLTRLVENILHFSRSERGQLQPVEREPADLGREARAVVASFAPLLRPQQAELEVTVPDGLGVGLDRDGFRQVLLNLLDNAVKYGPAGQTVRVSGSSAGDSVRLTVEDEGPGVPERERARIFEPFRRGGDAVGGVVTGSGIGLAVVREIVSAHGGSVRVETGARGARFVVELPRLRTVENEQVRRDRHAPVAADTGAAGAA